MVGLVGEQADVPGCVSHQDKQLWPVDQELGCQHIDVLKVLHQARFLLLLLTLTVILCLISLDVAAMM